MSDMLQLQDISKSYPMGEERLQVLKHVCFSAQKGEFISILGASGSGKIHPHEHYRVYGHS